jgi:hypothetical protein
MKFIYSLLLLAVLALVTPAFATDDTLQVDVTKLDQQQLKVYQEMKAMQARSSLSMENLTPDKIDRYSQMGKGLGMAINEGLKAVTTNVEQFSQTSAGKWLMVLITWKVMGEDAVGLARTAVQLTVGLTLFIVGIPFWMWLVKRNCVNRPIAKIEKTGFWTKNIIYTDRLALHEGYTIVYGVCFLLYLGAVAAITFLH